MPLQARMNHPKALQGCSPDSVSKPRFINVLGMDPSLSNWAFAAARLNTATHELTLRNIELARTSKSSIRKQLVCTDDLNRAKILSDAVFQYAPHAHAIFVEVPTGSQSSRGALGSGVCIGILAAMRTNKIPFFQVTPTELKLASVGTRTASKEAVIEWAMDQYPDLEWPMTNHRGKISYNKEQANHMADAIACIHAGIKTDQFQQLVALSR
jgi:Holliday junction resolvasome RuvABC endonuclease subunit